MQDRNPSADEVFISYSRKDKAFVTRLHAALEANGRTPWVDWGMEPLERWEQSIRHAIDRSIAVVVVLTPDWLASRECAKELQRATEQNKRLLPLLCRKVDDGMVDNTIGSINWINFSDDARFDAAVAELLKGLDEDPEWKRRLAQLLTRAVRWDDSGRDVSQTLRGRELRDAEQLLAAAVQNTPKPTELQTHYVLESRKAVARRQRFTLGAVAFAVLVAVSLSIVAYFQNQEKSRQERIAAARQLTNQAEALRDIPSKPDGIVDSVRIGVQALQAAAALNVESASADETVRRSLDLLPALPTVLPSGTVESRAVAFDPSGRYLAIAHLRDRISIWNLAEQRELEVAGERLSVPGREIRAVAVTPDARNVAASVYDVTTGNSEVIVWALPQLTIVAKFRVAGNVFGERVGLSPDAAYLYLSGLSRTTGWNVGSGAPLNPFPADARPSAIAFSPEGGRLAIAYRLKGRRMSSVAILDAKTLASQASWDESGLVYDIRWIGDAELAVIGRTVVFVRDARRGAFRHSYAFAYQQGDPGLAFDGQGRWIAESGPGYAVTVRDADSGRAYRRLLHPAEVKALAFGPDDRSMVTFAVDNKIRLWRLGTGSAFAELAHGDPILEVEFAGDALITRNESQTRRWTLPPRGQLTAALVERGGGQIAAPATPARLSARVSADRKQVALVDRRGEAVKTLDFTAPVGAAVVSESGRRLGVLLSADATTRRLEVRPTIETWDLERMAKLSTFTADEAISRADFAYLSFDFGERFLVTKSDDGFRLWDVDTLVPLYRIFHGAPALIAFQPKGLLAVTASHDETLRVWRLEEKVVTEVARLQSPDAVRSLALDADGRWVATAGDDGRARLWLVQPDELIAQACERVPPPCG